MNQETVIYLTNIVIAAILACMITHYWLRQGRTETMRCWVIAVWVMTVADLLFAARPELPLWMGRIVPTLLVTVGHAVLLCGASKASGRSLHLLLPVAIIAVHAAGLVYFLSMLQPSSWRMVFNGSIWAFFSFASFLMLRKAPAAYWKPLFAPANAFLLHGIFHCLRLGLALLFKFQGWEAASASLQIVGDLEVSFFMVALFVGILVANLQLRNDELTAALGEVHTLSGLLPICAWCKKVRNDEGYWQRVEDYFASRSAITFTHGICGDCFKTIKARGPK